MPQKILNCAFLLPFSVYSYLPKSVQFYLPITALEYESFYYKTVKNILERGIDLQTDLFTVPNKATPDHENIRGGNYFQ